LESAHPNQEAELDEIESALSIKYQIIREMKKLMFLAGFVLASGLGFAQKEEKVVIKVIKNNEEIRINENGDTTIVQVEEEVEIFNSGNEAPRSDKPIKTGVSKRSNWSGFDMGVNMLFTPERTSDFNGTPHLDFDPAKSWTFNFNFFEHFFSLYKDGFGVVTGLGVNLSHFGYRGNYTVNYDMDSIFGFVDPNRSYSRNRLRAAYLQIPLLLQINFPAKSSDNFNLSYGFVGGVRIGSRLRQKYIENNQSFDIKEKRGQYFFNSFKADATIRLGYGDWGAFVNYSIVPLFDKNVVDPVYNFSFGLMFNF
jgi:hypothetical protein